jgi:hypothetical protein
VEFGVYSAAAAKQLRVCNFGSSVNGKMVNFPHIYGPPWSIDHIGGLVRGGEAKNPSEERSSL